MPNKNSTEVADIKAIKSFQTPDIIIDRLMAFLTDPEFKVLMYIVRRTLGFGKVCDRVSLGQFMSGIKTKKGAVLDFGCGMSEKAVKVALVGLKQYGVIVETQLFDKFQSLPAEYAVRWEAHCIDWDGLFARKAATAERFALRNEKLKVTDYANQKRVTPLTSEVPPPPYLGSTLPLPTSQVGYNKTELQELSKDSESCAFASSPPTDAEVKTKTPKTTKVKKQPKELSPEELELERKAKAIMAAYARTVLEGIPHKSIGGYRVNWGRELAAAKSLAGENWTPEQVTACYISLKSESFWSGKHLALVSVEKQIGAFHAKQPANTGSNTSQPHQAIAGVASRTEAPKYAYKRPDNQPVAEFSNMSGL